MANDLASALMAGLRQKTYAQQLAADASSTAPTPSWGAALARALQGGLAGVYEESDKAKDIATQNAMIDMLQKGNTPAAAPMAPPSVSTPMGSPKISGDTSIAPSSVPTVAGEPNELDTAQYPVGPVGRPVNFGNAKVPEQYRDLITSAADSKNLPPQLLAQLLSQESRFNPQAVSPAGAVGIAQFMPKTAAGMGVNPLDPNSAIPGAAAYLAEGRDKYGGDLRKAAMYYHGGPDESIWGPKTRAYADAVTAGVVPPGPVRVASADPNMPANALAARNIANGFAPDSTPTPPGVVSSPPPQPAPQQVAQTGGLPAQPANDELLARLDAARKNPALSAEQRKAAGQIMLQRLTAQPELKKLNDDTLYDEHTGRTITVTPGHRPLTDPAERAKYGIPKEDNRPYQVGPGNKLVNPPAETRFTVDQRGESAFSTEAGKLTAKRYNDLVDDVPQAKQMLSDVKTLQSLGGQIGTGKEAQVKQALGPYAEALGIKIDNLGEIQAYDAIVQRLAPSLRVKGSGAQSDFELKNFLKSLPSLGNTPEGNDLIARTMDGLYKNKLAAADIGSQALNGEITRSEADKKLRELADPMQEYRDYVKQKAAEKTGTQKTGTGVEWSIGR